jgi:hypothetical protein
MTKQDTENASTDHTVLTAEEASKHAGCSVRVILDALREGGLKGRNLQGRKGWVITQRSLSKWIEVGNSDKPQDEASAG